MSAYSLLLEIEVRHGYYTDEACPSLRLEPTPACRQLLSRVDGLTQLTARGLMLWVNRDRLDDLQSSEIALSWTLHLTDNAYADCTDMRGRAQREVLLFDATNAVLDAASGLDRLHRLETASNQELCACSDLDIDGQLALTAPHGAPCGLVRIPGTRLRVSKRFLIRFAPRATVWTYYLIGDWYEPDLHIVDLAAQISFEPLPARRLTDGRIALPFRSSLPIPLHQHSPERFQLRSRTPDLTGAGTAAPTRTRPDKVLVKRLPAAAPRHVSREVIDGTPTWVSEIFVHR